MFSQDLAAVFAERECTVPVQIVRTGAVTRAFFDCGVETINSEHEVSLAANMYVLHVLCGALPGLNVDDDIRVGALGAAAVVPADPKYLFRGPVTMQDDGAFDHLAVVKA